VSGGITVTMPLLELSWPTQFVPIFGVTEYFQSPAGTELSMQLRAAIVPVQALRMVWSADVPASYLLMT
jgi:hypothetical protein